jgi:hypothetical protein
MAEPRPFRNRTARALATRAIAALLLLQLLVPAFAGHGLATPAVPGWSVCHAAENGGAPAPSPAPHHCAYCPCFHIIAAPPPALSSGDALTLLAEAAQTRQSAGAAPLAPAGRAGAWSSRAPPLA